jgi:V8-like Glu-specific endopeptidase
MKPGWKREKCSARERVRVRVASDFFGLFWPTASREPELSDTVREHMIASAGLVHTFGVLLALTPPSSENWLPIIGGEEVPEGEWPEVVALRARDFLCTGTLIAPQVVLTAAHCFAHVREGDEIEVYKGSNYDPSTSVPVGISTNWAGHPAYCGAANCGDTSYDYGYIVLPEAVNLPLYPAPITTQEEWDEVMKKGATLRLIGFGETETKTSGKKLFVDTSIAQFSPKGLQFFTAGDGKDSCRGDSGGPAMAVSADGQSWRLAGVLSSGAVECGEGGWYGVPIAVLDWVQTNTPYKLPNGACASLDCIDIDPSRGSKGKCAFSPTTPAQDLLAGLTLVAIGWGNRRRRAKRG